MTDDETTRTASESLGIAGASAAKAGVAARRYLRRYLLGLGAGFAAWLLVLAAIGQWLTLGAVSRAAVTGASVALVMTLAIMPARAEPVRARLGGAARTAIVIGGAVLFAVPAAFASDLPVIAAAGALVVMGYWALLAWRLGRAG